MPAEAERPDAGDVVSETWVECSQHGHFDFDGIERCPKCAQPMRCEACRFAVDHGKQHGFVDLYCHRRSPVIGGTSYEGMVRWPPVREFDWCGDFEVKS